MVHKLYGYDKIKSKPNDLDLYYNYVQRKKKYKKYFDIDTFEMICRLTYILGEPLNFWIKKFKKV
jgi:hypothetical protein